MIDSNGEIVDINVQREWDLTYNERSPYRRLVGKSVAILHGMFKGSVGHVCAVKGEAALLEFPSWMHLWPMEDDFMLVHLNEICTLAYLSSLRLESESQANPSIVWNGSNGGGLVEAFVLEQEEKPCNSEISLRNDAGGNFPKTLDEYRAAAKKCRSEARARLNGGLAVDGCEQPRVMPGILVNVCNYGKSTLSGTVKEVLSDGTCVVRVSSVGGEELVTCLLSDVAIVAPNVNDWVKILGGENSGKEGKLRDIKKRNALVEVKEDFCYNIVRVDIHLVAKLEGRAAARSDDVDGRERPRVMPGIMVNVCNSGKSTLFGIVKEVLLDGTCVVRVSSVGDEELATCLLSDVAIVAPNVNDWVKILGGENSGKEGRLRDIKKQNALVEVKEDFCYNIVRVDIHLVAKSGARATARSGLVVDGPKQPRVIPGILVNVCNFGKSALSGIVKEVLSDGTCVVRVSSVGGEELATCFLSDVAIVAPKINDWVKILGGKYSGREGKLCDINHRNAFVELKEEFCYSVVREDIQLVAKSEAHVVTGSDDGLVVDGPKQPRVLPGILVNVCNSGKSALCGTVKEVLSDGTCVVRVSSVEGEELATCLLSDVAIVAPNINDWVKILGGKFSGREGKLSGIVNRIASVELTEDFWYNCVGVDIHLVAKMPRSGLVVDGPEQPRVMPGILVHVCNYGKSAFSGTVKEVLSDDTCVVRVSSVGGEELATCPLSNVAIVAPTKNDWVKILRGEYSGREGVLFGIVRQDAVVRLKEDRCYNYVTVHIHLVGKMSQP